MTVQQFVVRLAPITSQPLLVHADSLKDGQLKAIVGEETKTIGVDWFRASAPVDPEIAHKIVQEYAKKHGIDEHSILVRSRLPKTNVKPRKTNDAALTLVQNKQEEQPKKEEPKQDLTQMAQAMQDAHDKQKKGGKSEQKASATNPEGATVKRTEEEKKPAKRGYQKRDKERSARSRAAYERYVKELGQQISESPTAMQPAVPGPGVSDAEVDEATLQFAMKLAKLLKGVM
jgi:hypothetical protein